jgi:hypothetical protein
LKHAIKSGILHGLFNIKVVLRVHYLVGAFRGGKQAISAPIRLLQLACLYFTFFGNHPKKAKQRKVSAVENKHYFVPFAF